MNKHTPWPWHSARLSKTTWNVGIYGPDGSTLAVINNASALCAERCDADARLMAAAPELLAALLAIRNSGPQGGKDFSDWHPDEPAITLARCAIAYATGSES